VDELARIQTFIRVVEAGSFTAAARRVASVSAIARQVRSLEEDLGVRLLNRSTRRLSLTEPGRAFYERVRLVANALEEARSEASSWQQRVKGVLRVSLTTCAGRSTVVPALPRLLADHPELHLELSFADDHRDLIADAIDVALCEGSLADSEFVARRVGAVRYCACASPTYLRRRGTPARSADLPAHNALLLAARGAKWQFCRAGSCELVELAGTLCAEDGAALASLAVAGTGIALLPECLVREELASGQLVRLLTDYTLHPALGATDLYAVCASARGLSRKVRVFVDFLAEVFAEPPHAQRDASRTRHPHLSVVAAQAGG
jgi:DNA-binding transcriptional LysR family regulator